MKSILISIKPEFVEKILNGEKTIEIRKTKPSCELPCKVYIYCTQARLPKQDTDCVRADHLTKPHPINKKYYLGANYGECLNGKVVAEFTLNKVDEFHIPYEAKYLYDALNSKNQNILKQSCLDIEEILKYLKDKYYCYAWHIDNLKIYDKPKELSEFKHWVVDCQGWCNKNNKTENVYVLEQVKRPPQSYMFVEEIKKEQ